MKRLKKAMALVITLVLSLAILPTTNVEAAAKAKINKKKVTIYVGKTVQLKIKNNKKKVKWSTSNKKVATVSKKGKVKGKKAGKATITAKVGTKKYKCKVTVKKGVLKSNKNTVSMIEGQSEGVIVTFKARGTISYKIKNKNVVSCKWGEFSNNDCLLTITAEQTGNTIITISNNYNNEKVVIKVDVKTKEEIMENKVIITLKNQLPATFTDYTYSGRVSSRYILTGFYYDVEYSEYSDDYDFTFYFTGEKTYDSNGRGQSKAVEIGWKLYDSAGYVVDSGTAYTSSLKEGEKFKNADDIAFNIKESGNYVLEILNTN